MPNMLVVVDPVVKLSAPVYPSCLQTTSASVSDQPSSQTVLHEPLMLTSTLPAPGISPPIILTLDTPVAIQISKGKFNREIHIVLLLSYSYTYT